MSTINSPIGSAYDQSGNNSNSKALSGSSELDQQDFLQLLISQLQNQNPMSPMDDTQFIAQMAQFSSLEQMGNMVTAVQELKESMITLNSQSLLTQGAAMIGKEVVASNGDEENVTGVVTSVKWLDGSLNLMVGEKSVMLEDILEIK